MQWTMWAMTELDMRLFEILMLHMPAGVHPIGEPEGYRVYFGREKTAKTTPQWLQWLYNELVWPLGVLEGAREGRLAWRRRPLHCRGPERLRRAGLGAGGRRCVRGLSARSGLAASLPQPPAQPVQPDAARVPDP
eukprot:COSAG06_NODE_703_length_12909_cov_33.909758_5_plen_135_part_00